MSDFDKYAPHIARLMKQYEEHGIKCPRCEDIFLAVMDDGLCYDCHEKEQAARDRQANAPKYMVQILGDKMKKFHNAHFDHYVCVHKPQQRVLAAVRNFANKARGKGLILLGATGTGKTYLACCVMRHWLEQGCGSLDYFCLADLFSRIKEAYNNPRITERALIERFSRYDLLVLDECDKIAGSAWEIEQTFPRIVDRLWNRGSHLILVGNCNKPKQGNPVEQFKGMWLPETVDRIRDMVQGAALVFDWESYRGK